MPQENKKSESKPQGYVPLLQRAKDSILQAPLRQWEAQTAKSTPAVKEPKQKEDKPGMFSRMGAAVGNALSDELTFEREPEKKNPVSIPVQETGENIDIDKVLEAIAYNETRGVTGDKTTLSKPSGSEAMGDDMGTFQVTEAELEAWANDFLGRKVSKEEFLNSEEVQREFMEKKVEALAKEGLTAEEILAIHRGGLTGYADPEVRKKKLEERADYVTSGLEFLRGKTSVDETQG